MRMIAAASVALFLAVSAASQPSGKVGQKTDWIDTAEAYFATQPEKVEWGQLRSDEERKAFIDRYWLKRDPTPGTPRNEFRDVIIDRIVKAERGQLWINHDAAQNATIAHAPKFYQ